MSAQDIILGARVAHVRELKTEVGRLQSENARLRDENAALLAHFDLALVAAQDLRALPPEGRFVIVDGWNQILGVGRKARSVEELLAKLRVRLAENPRDFIWVVFDGPKENVFNEPRMRVSYTGGTGPHRADRFIVDFVRMARYLGLHGRISVETADKDFLARVKRLLKP